MLSKKCMFVMCPDDDELSLYMSLPKANYGDVNSLDWWRRHALTLPNVSLMARQYLASPATSASVERLFSRAGRYHDALKKRTKDTTIETLLIVAQNVYKDRKKIVRAETDAQVINIA